MSVVAKLEELTLKPEMELSALLDAAEGIGAAVTFTGIARPTSNDGNSVDSLVLEHHPTLTVRSLEEIGRDAEARFGVTHIRIIHRCGSVDAGQPIVFAGAASAHRRAAFEAADYLMDRLKTEAIFWKREVGNEGSRWIEPSVADYEDRERWERDRGRD